MEQGRESTEGRGQRIWSCRLRVMLFLGLCRVTRAHTSIRGSEPFVQQKLTSPSLCSAKHLWNLASLSCSPLSQSQCWPVCLWGFEMSPLHTQPFHWKLCFPHRRPDYNILVESVLETLFLKAAFFAFFVIVSKWQLYGFLDDLGYHPEKTQTKNLYHCKALVQTLRDSHLSFAEDH